MYITLLYGHTVPQTFYKAGQDEVICSGAHYDICIIAVLNGTECQPPDSMFVFLFVFAFVFVFVFVFAFESVSVFAAVQAVYM